MLDAIICGNPFKVKEIAETSMCISVRHIDETDGDDNVSGVVFWSNGEHTNFTGVLGPITNGSRVIVNLTGVTTKAILDEQRRLLKDFPGVQ